MQSTWHRIRTAFRPQILSKRRRRVLFSVRLTTNRHTGSSGISQKKEPNVLDQTNSISENDVAKTIGVKVKPQLYKQLVKLKDERKLKSMKEALLLAATTGVDTLLDNGR